MLRVESCIPGLQSRLCMAVCLCVSTHRWVAKKVQGAEEYRSSSSVMHYFASLRGLVSASVVHRSLWLIAVPPPHTEAVDHAIRPFLQVCHPVGL
jgi:hypothetical protein